MRRVALALLILPWALAAAAPQAGEGAPHYDARGLRDPFRPVGKTRVVALLRCGDRSCAVVRNAATIERVVVPGDTLDGNTILGIDLTGVQIRGPGGLRCLALTENEGQSVATD